MNDHRITSIPASSRLELSGFRESLHSGLFQAIQQAIEAQEHLIVETGSCPSELLELSLQALSECGAEGIRAVVAVASEAAQERLISKALLPLHGAVLKPFHLARLDVGTDCTPETVPTVHVATHMELFTYLAELEAGWHSEAGFQVVILADAQRAVDSARSAFGFRLTLEVLEPLIFPLTTLQQSGLKECLLRRAKAFFGELEAFRSSPRYHVRLRDRQPVPNFELLDDLEHAAQLYERAGNGEDADLSWGALAGQCRQAASLIAQAMELVDSNLVVSIKSDTRGQCALVGQRIDIAALLSRALFSQTTSVIAISATLSWGGSLERFRSELGVPDGARELVAPSPTHEHHQFLTVVPEDVPDPSERAWPAIASLRVAEAVSQVQGRIICLISSPLCLELAWRALRRSGRPLVCHGVTPPADLARTFREESASVLLATQDAVDAMDLEDVPFECLLIDRLPFPLSTDPILDALKERDMNWFVHHSLPVAVSAFKCRLGLLRAHGGRKVVTVLDQRLVRRPYGRLFVEGVGGLPISRDLTDIWRFLSGSHTEKNR